MQSRAQDESCNSSRHEIDAVRAGPCAICASVTVTPPGYRPRSISDRTRSPDRLCVEPIRLTMVARSTSGVPRQFMAMCENSRCSILFHLLVPGGK